MISLLLLSGLATSATARLSTGLPLGYQTHQNQQQPNNRRLQNSSATASTSDYPRKYHLLPPSKIKSILYDWVSYYPNLVRLTNAQERYGLPRAGGKTDCPYDEGDGCKNYILTIQDFVKHPEGSDSSNRLPEVFLSGELHGNERTGPTSVMEAAQLMLLAANCEAKTEADKEECRAQLKEHHGMDDVHRRWLARLVSTRRIVIVPTANALGYFRNRREENHNDPNRDFPYDVQDATQCMKTIAGRTLNEIFREHLFQLSLTFHGGMEVVGYEWGAPTWLGHLSPDHTAQDVIGAAYSQYGGGFATSPAYKYGTMNDLVYFVRGGFEDWAYAGSWDPKRVLPCQPREFGGYDAAKTQYNNSTLRVFNMLVETSNNKEPADNTLGTSLRVFDKDTTGNGHTSRNIRLSLLAGDVVQPYVHLVGVNEATLTTDIVPLTARTEDRGSCQSVVVPPGNNLVELRWTVGGAFAIDSTELWYAKWDDVPADVLDCNGIMPSRADIEKYFAKSTMNGATSGTGFFSKEGPAPLDSKQRAEALGPVFEASMDVSGFQSNDKIVVVAGAVVDQHWKSVPKDYAPKVPPQSHVVNARTNPDWHHESAGKIVQGRVDWYSLPLTVVVGDNGAESATVELSNRLDGSPTKTGIAPSAPASTPAEAATSSAGSEQGSNGGQASASASAGGGVFSLPRILGVAVLAACALFIFRRYRGVNKRDRKSVV